MKVVDRPHRWITVDPVLDRTRLEIRIRCADPPRDTPARLDAKEAYTLAYALLTMADELVGADTQPVRPVAGHGAVVALRGR